MRKWRVSIFDDEAAQEVASLYLDRDGKYDEDREREVERILTLLAFEEDPRQPSKSSGLIVGPLHSTPEWYRVKVPRYAMRLVFRLLVVREGRIYRVSENELPSEKEERYLDVTRAGRHPDVYSRGLRDRYKKLGGQ